MGILINILLGLWMLVSLLMILVILMQRPKSEGLGAAFGGAVTENIFGAQTTNVLVKFTGWLAGIFFVLTFLLSIMYAHRNSTSGDSALRRELMKTQATTPAASPAASGVPQASPVPTGVVTGTATPAASASPVASAPAASVAPSASPASSPNK